MTCLTKIKIQKFITLLLFVFFSTTSAQADSWVKIKNNKNLPLYIETMFIEYNYNNQSAVYTIKYQNRNLMNFILMKSDCKNSLAGVADNKTGLSLNSNYSFAYSTVSAPMKNIQQGTPIYYAHNYVCKQLKKTPPPQEKLLNTQEPDFEPYMRELQKTIRQNWDPPKGKDSKKVVLLFKLGLDGSLINYHVMQSSGSQAVDRAAIHALQLSAPFKPLPAAYKGDSLDIQFTFDYTVYETN